MGLQALTPPTCPGSCYSGQEYRAPDHSATRKTCRPAVWRFCMNRNSMEITSGLATIRPELRLTN